MERIDISDDARWTALVEAAERGEEAALTRGGEVVAKVVPDRPATGDGEARKVDWTALRHLHEVTGYRDPDATALIRAMRDMDVH